MFVDFTPFLFLFLHSTKSSFNLRRTLERLKKKNKTKKKKNRCYPLSAAHPCDGASAVLWRDPDLRRWPRFASLRCLWAELGPGDVLRVPAYWIVHSELLLPPSARGGGSGGGAEGEGEREGCVTLVLRSPAARRKGNFDFNSGK